MNIAHRSMPQVLGGIALALSGVLLGTLYAFGLQSVLPLVWYLFVLIAFIALAR